MRKVYQNFACYCFCVLLLARHVSNITKVKYVVFYDIRVTNTDD